MESVECVCVESVGCVECECVWSVLLDVGIFVSMAKKFLKK